MRKWVQIILAIMGGSLGYSWSDSILRKTLLMSDAGQVIWINSLCAVGMFFLSSWVASQGMKLLMRGEKNVADIPVSDLLSGTLGLVIGLLISVLVFPVLEQAKWASPFLPFIVSAVLAVMGFRIGYSKREELVQIIAKSQSTARRSRRTVLMRSIRFSTRVSLLMAGSLIFAKRDSLRELSLFRNLSWKSCSTLRTRRIYSNGIAVGAVWTF